MPILLTEKEEAQLDTAKGYFYYPSTDSISEAIQTLLKQIPKSDQPQFTSSLFQELFYEQEQRRLYILGTLGVQNLDRDESEVLIRQVARNSNTPIGELLQKVDPSAYATSASVPDEVKAQAQTFATVAQSIAEYFSDQTANQRVKGIFTILKNVPSDQKQQFHQQIQSFIAEVGKIFDQQDLTSTRVAPGIEETLTKYGLDAAYRKLATLGEQVTLLALIDQIISLQLANDSQNPPVSDQELIHGIALWSYYQDPPPILNFEDETTS